MVCGLTVIIALNRVKWKSIPNKALPTLIEYDYDDGYDTPMMKNYKSEVNITSHLINICKREFTISYGAL